MEKVAQGHPMTQSPDFVKENIELLKSLFPTIVKEGKIDLEELQALLGDEVESDEEYYRFTWAGKSLSRKEANKPSTATLRPNKADSKDWDTTQNIFIEGDNLEVLKLLQKSYTGKIKIMYFDPPYNTGKDFVYKDNYTDNLNNYLSITGQLDDEGKRTSTNTESDGRFHSNWLNMMYPRLKLARNLMTEDGAIFISSDNEITNLRKLCDEVFGEDNFIECISWNKRIPKNDKGIGNIHEYILLYVKNATINHEFFMRKDGLEDISDLLEKLKKQKTPINEAEFEIKKLYKKKGYDRGITLYNSITDEYKLWGKINMSWPNADTFGPRYEVLHPITKEPVKIPNRGWRWKEETFNDAARLINGEYTEIKKLHDGTYMCGRIWFDSGVTTQPSSITFLDEVNDFLLRSILSLKSDGGIEVEELFEGKSFFSYPKPTSLIKILLDSVKLEGKAIILDIFAGSGTTADAVMQLNAEDRGTRKFICIQLPEPTEEKSEAFKAGFNNLAEITKARIQKAGEKIKSKQTNDLFSGDNKALDFGFKAFKLDSSNINAWDGNPENLQANLFNAGRNIKENRTEDDVLFEILLKNGLDLAQPIDKKAFAGKNVFNIGLGTLFICLADGVTTEVAEGIGKWKLELEPATCKVIFKDNGFTDVEKTNSMQILKRYGIEEVNTI
jgi:adenine-specific DNA-methyltransferase